jgi:hypothetical protein
MTSIPQFCESFHPMADILMPASFPLTDFRAFGVAATAFFPGVVSDEALFDPEEKRRHFDSSWQAVRYRYRSCAECSDEFKALLVNASDMWKAGWGDEELTYKLERCIYVSFTSALSVFDSFAFCLYFFGNALEPTTFSRVSNPRVITRDATARAFKTAFPQAAITGLLACLSQDERFGDARFRAIDNARNLVGHRISGRRSVRASSTIERDGTHTQWREETWHLPGATGKLFFDDELLQRHLEDVTGLLESLSAAAREFAEAEKLARKPSVERQS